MFRIRNLAFPLAMLCGNYAAAQSLPLDLHPGDIVIADTPGANGPSAIRVLRTNGSVDSVYSGNQLRYPGGILIDRDGAVLVSNWLWQSAPENLILRLDPAGGSITSLNNAPLHDNFSMVRNSNGDLVVADGFAGLARIDDSGDVFWYSSPGLSYDVSLGVDLDFDGNILLCESYNYGSSTPNPGSIYSVDADGVRTLLAQDPQLLYSPNDLALAPDGSIIATNYHQANPINDLPRVVQVQRNGSVSVLAEAGILQKPKGVHINEWGEILVADTDDQSILQYDGAGGMQRVLWDLSDGVDNGNPIDRPFAMDQVPSLWLRTDLDAMAGTMTHAAVEGIQSYWGQPIVLAVSTQHSATAMNLFWPGSPRISHVDLLSAQTMTGSLPVNGTPAVFVGFVPPFLAGSALHLQAFLAAEELPSNYIALPVQ